MVAVNHPELTRHSSAHSSQCQHHFGRLSKMSLISTERMSPVYSAKFVVISKRKIHSGKTEYVCLCWGGGVHYSHEVLRLMIVLVVEN